MIGVVVWSSAERQKAVIWCEDQGALAYLQGAENLAPSQSIWPDAGDLLELETEVVGPLRHARRVSLIGEGVCPQIPAILRGETPAQAKPKQTVHLRLVANTERSVAAVARRLPSLFGGRNLRSAAAS